MSDARRDSRIALAVGGLFLAIFLVATSWALIAAINDGDFEGMFYLGGALALAAAVGAVGFKTWRHRG